MKKIVKLLSSVICFMMMLSISNYAQAPLQWYGLHQRPGGNTGNLLGSAPKECNYDVKHLSSGNAIGVGKAYPVGSNPNVDCDIAIRKYRASDGAVVATYYTDYYNGGRFDAAIKIIVAEPNIYVLATSEWISGTFDKDIILLKLDTALNYQWGQYFTNGAENDEAVDMGMDAAGNIYIVGNTRRSGTGDDIVLLKYDQNGTNLFTKYFSSSGNFFDKATAMAVEPIGICNITGSYGHISYGQRLVVLKTWGNGVQLWVKYHDAFSSTFGADYGTSITYDPATSDVYVSGSGQNGTADYDWTIVKFAGVDGTKLWSKKLAGVGGSNDEGASIRLTSSGELYACGNINTTVSGVTSRNIQLLKLNPASGANLFSKIYNYQNGSWGPSIEIAKNMLVTPAGNVYITGSMDFPTPTYYDANHLVLCYSSAGTLLWSHNLSAGSTSNIQDYEGNALSFSATHNTIYVGGFKNTTMSNLGYASMMKFGPVSLTNPNNQLREEEKEVTISVLPNPATDFIIVKTEELVEATVELYDITGKLITKDLINDTSNTLNVSQLPRGAYILRYVTEKSVQSKQIILN